MPNDIQKREIAVHALIKNGDKYLVVKRSESEHRFSGFWDIPGGKINFGEEDCVGALHREIFEETGLKTEIGNIIFLYSQFSQDNQTHYFQFIYESKYLGGEITLDPREHVEYKWVTQEELGRLKNIMYLQDLYQKVLTK